MGNCCSDKDKKDGDSLTDETLVIDVEAEACAAAAASIQESYEAAVEGLAQLKSD